MKIKLSYMLSFILLMASTANAANRAVEIDIGGIGPAVDAAAADTVKQVIGYGVANGTLDKFLIRGVGIEGGFSACAQASPFSKNFGSFVKQLRTIKPDRNTTAYSVRSVPSCSEDLVACTQEVKLCPDGKTYVGRISPSCAFAPCPGL
jgi:hypothetical protein